MLRLLGLARRTNESPLNYLNKRHLLQMIIQRSAVDILRKAHSLRTPINLFSEKVADPNELIDKKIVVDEFQLFDSFGFEHLDAFSQLVVELLLSGYKKVEVAELTGKSLRTVGRAVLKIRQKLLSDCLR